MGRDLDAADVTGEWIGLAKLSAKGTDLMKTEIAAMRADGSLENGDMNSLFSRLVKAGADVRILYVTGHWLDVDNAADLEDARDRAGQPHHVPPAGGKIPAVNVAVGQIVAVFLPREIRLGIKVGRRFCGRQFGSADKPAALAAAEDFPQRPPGLCAANDAGRHASFPPGGSGWRGGSPSAGGLSR